MITADSFLYDTAQLNTLAKPETVKRGLAYFNENRVFALDIQEDQLEAQVEGSLKDQPYWVQLSLDEDGHLLSECDCAAKDKICKHAIATLYSYADFCMNKERENVSSAIDEAINERVKKGRNEVSVKLISGNLAFGVWQAESLISSTFRKTTYQVSIRSLDQRKNYCTCPDLATNRLGTCKHIEAVLHYAKKQRGYKKLLAQGSPVSFVYLSWESATTPFIRLHKAPTIDAGLNQELAEFFDADACFMGRLPETFQYFLEKFATHEDLIIGEDAQRYVRQCAADALQTLRGQEISQLIKQANGVLPGIKKAIW